MYLIFDTETTGIPRNKNAPLTDLDNWPRLVQLAWQLHGSTGALMGRGNLIIRPEGFDIPFKAEQVHGISTARALQEGQELGSVIRRFSEDLAKASLLIGHNIEFDINIIGAEMIRCDMPPDPMLGLPKFDTSRETIDFCQLPGGPGGRFKMPRLGELHIKLFGKPVGDAHDAAYDVEATARCYFALMKEMVARPADDTPVRSIQYEAPVLEAGNASKRKSEGTREGAGKNAREITAAFAHLHVHSQFSILQATPDAEAIVKAAKDDGMEAVALTDLGNLFGAFKFVSAARAAGLKPLIGCEFFLSEERKKNKFTKESPDRRHHQVLIAKNETGYQNLSKLSSLGYTEGLYGIHPRIDKALVEEHKDGLMATTGSIHSEIPHLILNVGIKQAEQAFLWWKKLFGQDFYVELNRHGIPEEDHVNSVLLDFCRKHQVRYFPANEAFYLKEEDARAHDVLLCIRDGEFVSTPIGEGRGKRHGLPNSSYYFKTQAEMRRLFQDLPEAFDTISEIIAKVESFPLDRKVALPRFDIPAGFETEDDYLRHLTFEGAKRRYTEITPSIRERLDFELETIKKTGYPGYFLIVADFTTKAREMGVSVGPGRGSAAGSAVAYCIGITNVDPIAYDLLFERFLNPDRVSLPDIDIDFDDEGREKVIRYVIEKYGHGQVAQIITYGTMAAKSSIRDCARVMELPLPEANHMAKLIPEKPGTSLEDAFSEVSELNQLLKGDDIRAQVLQQAKVIEGSLRNTGLHACGIIITPKPLVELVPVSTAKDSTMLVTQFDNSVVEKAGMLKMDFLGLTTLSIIRTALKSIKRRHQTDIDIDKIPLDDVKTYQLYQRGETAGTFQFESDGMQAYLRQLRPDKFEDLIAMNALYRPGPMEYIPNFIARKHGREPISYDHADMAEYLEDTYGITVYQEQVMLLSQKLAGFSKGEADILRKAMGKKDMKTLTSMRSKFLEGCQARQYSEAMAEKVWKDWEAFAQYAFNKSHSTCYSMVAYQTAYLKANYPAEFMAAVLTHSQSNLDKVTYFIEECRRMGIPVLGPHINESDVYFEVNREGEIRFGLGAIRGAGESAVESIIQERDAKGAFADIFEFARRVNPRNVTRKTFECLALSGAFDCFAQYHRRQYIASREGEANLSEKAIRHAARLQQEESSAQTSLFGATASAPMPPPKVEPLEPFSELEKLAFEKEMVGVYISGHPLDAFRFELDSFCNASLSRLNDLESLEGKEIRLGGIVANVENRTTKSGKPFGKVIMEDFSGKYEFTFWSEDYLRFRNLFSKGFNLYIEGMVTRRSWGDRPLEFKVKSIELLNEIGVKRTRGLQLTMDPALLTSDTLRQVEDLCRQYEGATTLYVRLRDTKPDVNGKPLHVELISRRFRINPVNEAIRAFRSLPSAEMTIV